MRSIASSMQQQLVLHAIVIGMGAYVVEYVIAGSC
jgi:multisubunit Na+/H+ antiporter MnhC subunit